MKKNKDEDTEFLIPDNFLDKIYEFSGSADKNKGFILAVCNEKGDPNIYSRHESSVIEMGIIKAVKDYVDLDSNKIIKGI